MYFKYQWTLIDNAEDLYIIMFMYNFLENSHNYSKTSGTLWNYYRDDVNNDIKENNNFGNYRINNIKTTSTKSFEYKIILIGSTTDDDNTLDEKVAFTLKYLGNFGDSRIYLWLTVKSSLLCHSKKSYNSWNIKISCFLPTNMDLK